MKILASVTTIILAILIIISGCKKGSNSTTGSYYMKATIGSSSFDAEGLSQAYLTTSTSAGLNYNYLAGKATDGRLIQITLITSSGTPLAVGTLPLNTGIANADYYPQGLTSSYTYALSGSVTLTQLIPNLVGTFSFLCADSTNITNGSFSIRVQ